MAAKPVPALNPYLAPNIICPDCGDVEPPKVRQMANGKLTEIYYIHRNEERGCEWVHIPTMMHSTGQTRRIKPEDEKVDA